MKLGLAGDTMLGRRVGERLATGAADSLFAPEVVEAAHEADLLVLNLECCISTRGERWPDPRKPFFFRAPPQAIEVLELLGTNCVTLANNHALDFGREALVDTLERLRAAGIACVGAGTTEREARAPVVLEAAGLRLRVVAFADHPRDFAAGEGLAGIAFADLSRGLPEWVSEAVGAPDADAVLVTPHWGPNMATEPRAAVRAAGAALRGAGATLVAGHSAHVFQGVEAVVLYDLGDFVDDYATDPVRRNDLGLLWLVTFADGAPERIEALPLKLEYCHTGTAHGSDADWIADRLERACAPFGTPVRREDARLVIDLR